MENITKTEKAEKTPTKPNTRGIDGELKITRSNSSVPTGLKNVKDVDKKENIETNCENEHELKAQLTVLMNSLATLSAEKSRMEANFQADRRQLRAERDEYEKVVKVLREKLRQAEHTTNSEVEHVKYKLIMERHERDKNQADNSAMIKELQRLVTDERRAKESLEQQLRELKNQNVNKTQNKILEAELEVANNKLKQAEAAVKETPPMLVSLQAEIATLRKQHRNAIHEERKRAAVAEQRAKTLEAAHESRVAGLEARLAELSETVGGYDRLKHQDQHAIQKLKEQLSVLQKYEHREHADTNHIQDPTKIAAKMEELYVRLMEMNNEKNTSLNIKEFLKSFKFYDVEHDLEYREKYDALQREFDNYKEEMMTKLESLSGNIQIENKQIDNATELLISKSHCENLEERIRMLNKEMNHKEKEFNIKLEKQSQLFQKEKISYERILSQKETEFRGKIGMLEHQLVRQRERSLLLIEEKNQEIRTLKSSFHTMLMKNGNGPHFITDKSSVMAEKPIKSPSDFVNTLLTADSPPLLHYAQELARREIQITGLRKQNSELENTLRKNQRDLWATNQNHMDEIKDLETKIIRLEGYKSREGANLEYLKNVLVNYLTSTELSSKRHMLNAIATVLKFTHEEMEMIQRMK